MRLELGETLEQFGARFKTSKTTVFNWENGRNLPNKNNLKLIAELGNMTVKELVNGGSEMDNDKKAHILLDWVKNVIKVDEESESQLLKVIKYGLNEIEIKEWREESDTI